MSAFLAAVDETFDLDAYRRRIEQRRQQRHGSEPDPGEWVLSELQRDILQRAIAAWHRADRDRTVEGCDEALALLGELEQIAPLAAIDDLRRVIAGRRRRYERQSRRRQPRRLGRAARTA